MEEIYSRMTKYLEKEGISKSELGRRIDLANQTICQYLIGKQRMPAKFVENFLKVFPNLSAEWLLRGEGEMMRSLCQGQTINITRTGNNNAIANGGNATVNDSKDETINKLINQNQQLINALLNNK